MADIQQVFQRKESKYLISPAQYDALLKAVGPHLNRDIYFHNINCSVYYDTPDNQLISRSIEKPVFKQKIRVRSYNIPALEDRIFIELKKKFKGVGNKRRIAVPLQDFYKYLRTGQLESDQPIIAAEIDHCFQLYDLRPNLYIAYDRYSYCGADDPNFRVTFDFKLRSRLDRLRLEAGDAGDLYFDNDTIIMEAKSMGGMPFWFVKALSDLRIYPASFSKYGYIFQSRFSEFKQQRKELAHV